MSDLGAQIEEWRSFVSRVETVDQDSLEELEDHLRDQIGELRAAGLTGEEAFLVAVKRLGSVDALSREFAREHGDRLWKQLVSSADSDPGGSTESLRLAISIALAAAIAAQVLRFGLLLAGEDIELLVLRNASLVVLPFLVWYFAQRRGLSVSQIVSVAIPFAVGALLLNLYPWSAESSTEIQAALHAPVVLWFVVGYVYMGGDWRSRARRMDFVRFTGEWFIYYVLIALGGGVLTALTTMILEPLGADVSQIVFNWVLPSGAAGAVIISAWLVEEKQGVIENMAPVLTKVFTPLFAIMLTVSAVSYALTGFSAAFDRELLAVFDALLIVVLGLVLYAISAREPLQPPGIADGVQLVAVGGAVLLDGMVLLSMLTRIAEMGITPNRAAALGLNLVLLLNLVWAAWLSIRFLRKSVPFHKLERWQTAYLPVYPVWASAVAVILPLVFGFD